MPLKQELFYEHIHDRFFEEIAIMIYMVPETVSISTF